MDPYPRSYVCCLFLLMIKVKERELKVNFEFQFREFSRICKGVKVEERQPE